MKAVVIHEHGGREVLNIEDVAVPEPGPGQVLVEVHAVSVNRTLDIRVREGKYDGAIPPFPIILGLDPSGVVVKTGEGVERLAVGDRVSGVTVSGRSGGYAEYSLMPESASVIPDGLSYAEATVVTRHFPSAYSEIRRAGVKEGDWVLVMGAAGGLGSCAVQVAKRFGARVIAGASTAERLKATLELGADYGVNYRERDLTRLVEEITGGHGVDVVLENIGDPTLWPQAFDSLARDGRLVTIGAHGGGRVALNVERLYLRRLTIMHGMGGALAGDVDEALTLAAAGKYSALIDRVMPLSEVAEAHRLVEENEVLGKVILDPTLG
jgi:NADPH:quinone reductase